MKINIDAAGSPPGRAAGSPPGRAAGSPPGRPTGFNRRAALSVPLALVGLVAFGYAHTLPWVSVRPGQDIVHRLIGQTPSDEVRTFTLADLPGSLVALHLGWLALVTLLVLAWIRPQWRDAVRIGSGAAALTVTALTFLPSGAALRATGFPTADQPSTSYLSGTWLALAGMLLLSGALSTLLAPSKPSASAPPAPATAPDGSRSPDTEHRSAVHRPAAVTGHGARTDAPAPAGASSAPVAARTDPDPPAPLFGPPPGTAPQPVAASRPRRPLRVAATALGAVAAVLLVTVLAWPRAERPAARDTAEVAEPSAPATGLAALLVPAPDDATPGPAPVAHDRVDVTRIVTLDQPGGLPLVTQLADVRHAAGAAWTEPSSASMMVVLLQFGTPDLAAAFQASYADLERERRAPGSEVALTSVPGAAAFVGPTGDGAILPEVHAVAQHDDIVVLVSAGGGAADDATAAETLLRLQYDRL
ncbi:hypothetical protein AB0J20_17205 [Micromonospora costi]|uniref:hypothetical protein n=1 Tax=Micromonospora costi TaxID=1530042 RepID=UPI0033DE66DC